MHGEEIIAAMDPDTEVAHDFRPFLQQFKSGRVVRFGADDTLPAGADPAVTGVQSKDVFINPRSGLWARLYLPAAGDAKANKLPVVVYYHGGAFVVGSTAHRPTHLYLNRLAADANALIVSPEYRLAPEHPLPAAHDDSWEALSWVASHATATPGEGPTEPWVAERGDLSRVFLLGVSAGGNIAHHMAARAAAGGLVGVHIRAMLLVHPYFNGEAAIGSAPAEVKAMSEALWRFICPGTPGLDDPLCNPFAVGGGAARVAAGRVLVCVAEKDVLRDRAVWYFEKLKGSGYTGEVELLESEGQGHVFHYKDPECEQARVLHARVLSFLRDE